MKSAATLFSIPILLISILACNPQPPAGPGVAITFDDDSIEEWYDTRSIFKKYRARATYFVTKFHLLSAEEKEKLRILRDEYGHEIASHAYNHDDANQYPDGEEYIEQGVLPAIESMRAADFFPTSFAYPYGHHSESLDSKMVKLFDFVRGTSHSSPDRPIQEMDEIYHNCTTGRMIYGVGIDDSYDNSLADIQDGLDRALENDEVLILYAHRPSNDGGTYDIPPAKLEGTLAYAFQIGLAFYRITDLCSWKVSHNGRNPWEEIKRSGFKKQDLAFGDFNNDGKTDVFRTTGYDWLVSWSGENQWEHIRTSAVELSNLELGDFNGDGASDLFRVTGDNWYVSESHIEPGGKVTWGIWTWKKYSVANPDDLGFGDFDGNGYTDVFRHNPADGGKWEVSFSRNDGTMTNWRTTQTSNLGVDDLSFGDFNGDGATDIFRTSIGDWSVSTGDLNCDIEQEGGCDFGTWGDPVRTSVDVPLSNLAFADFDGNGTTDVFTATGSKWKVSFCDNGLRNESLCDDWTDINTSTTGIEELGFGDFDGDTIFDVIWAGARP